MTLTKLSSPDDFEINSESMSVIYSVMQLFCCKGCSDESENIDELLDTMCGAEFILEPSPKEAKNDQS